MTHPLLDVIVGDRRLRVVATERTDGDVHPLRTGPDTLAARQHAITGADRSWVMTDQVHGVDVSTVDGSAPWSPTTGVADVIVTGALDATIAIWAADCAPIVVAADDGTLVAAHGGWRGLAMGVVDVAVDAAVGNGGSVAAAVLGPVIHPCCYEFDPDDLATIPDAIPGRTSSGGPALDVPATVAASLARRGVDLDASGPCTGCDDRWFSHRVRSEPGRHAVIAWWEHAR
ncbi:MAG: polyphenol oxidase family protein [Ilumatobacter sp.]|uniref:polyphenol oxidase family protein n=1 Tax=Ilumatobacter sp. TaxID=1967498 RepID=UPI0032995F24